VGEGVYVKGEADVLFGRLENGPALDDAGVVDEDCGVADAGADLLGYGGDGLGGGDVAFEVVDFGALRGVRWVDFGGRGGDWDKLTSIVRQGLNIQHHNGDSPFSEQLHHLATDSASTAGDDYHLATPVVLVLDPVVEHPIGEVVV